MTNLDELRKAAEKATPGPWAFRRDGTWHCLCGDGMWFVKLSWTALGQRNADDAAFIARANPATILSLIGEIERLTYELKRWKEVEANRPDWEKLWGEQSEKADELKAQIARWEGIANGLGKQVQRLLAKEGERISDALRSGRISEAMKKD